MIKVSTTITIARSPAEVFGFISNFENNPRWQSGMVAARFTSEGELGVGTTYVQEARFLGRRVESTFKVLDFEPGHLVKASSTAGSFPITFTRIVEPYGGNCRVTAIVEGDASGFFKLAEPLLKPMVARSVREDYKVLKRILEWEQ